jgi:hypothetical protein
MAWSLGPSSTLPAASIHTVIRSWAYLIWFLARGPIRRHRLTLWVALILTLVVTLWVAVETQRDRWELRQRRLMRGGPTYGQLLDSGVYEQMFVITQLSAPVGQVGAGAWLVAGTVLRLELIHQRWGFMNFTLWVIHGVYLSFLLPLLILSCVNSWMDVDNEAWIWIRSRPLPHSVIYLAQWLAILPWSLLWGLGAIGLLAIASGTYGRWAWDLYVGSIIIGICSFTSVFHFIHAFFRRPIIVGLVYVFFFESLVGSLPGSLKLLSVTYHIRSLTYHQANSENFPTDLLLLPEVADPQTARWLLLVATIVPLIVGMWLTVRYERPVST